jgi:hypothetical protein
MKAPALAITNQPGAVEPKTEATRMIPPEALEANPLGPRAFIAAIDLSAIRRRAAVTRPSDYELAVAWDDRADLLRYVAHLEAHLANAGLLIYEVRP